MKKPFLIVISLLVFGLSLPASATINAWLDRNQVGPGESVQLTLQHDGQTDTQPDLSPLKQDFDVLGRGTSSSIQFINGKMSAQIQLSLVLAPKHSGKLLVPALQWDGQYSPALALTVDSNSATGQAGSVAPGNASHEFIVTSLDQKQPYVQAAVTLTVRLYVDESLSQASLELQPNNDVLIQQLGKDRQTSETRNGRDYQVVERKYLLFPQRSGRISLDGPVLNAQVQDTRNADSFFGNVFGGNPFAGMLNATRPLRIQGDRIVLNVRPRPTSGTGHDWLPAQNMTLEETWQPDNGPIHAGDPITRHLHLSARGLTASQLPDLSLLMPLPAGLRAYPDQPRLNTSVQGDGVIGTRDQDIALIASRSGRYVIPAMRLFWWDTTKNIQREVDLAAHTLDVLPSTAAFSAGVTPPSQNPPVSTQPASAPSFPSPNTADATTNFRWLWISLGLAVLWLGTLFAWWRNGRRNPKHPSSGSGEQASAPLATPRSADARKAFRQACRENTPQAARRHLLDWARAAWPNDPPIGLKAMAVRLDDPSLKPLLDQLDRACYAGGEWQGESLLEALKSLSDRTKPVVRSAPKLAGLYP
ncbi:MAG: BatD family protein [Sulfuricella sp.]